MSKAFVKGHTHGVSTRFQKGKSGNPGGRTKKIVEVESLVREHTVDAIKALASIVNDEKATPAARVTAANVLLDRGWGKPLTQVQHSGTISSLGAVLDAAFRRIDAEDDAQPDPETQH